MSGTTTLNARSPLPLPLNQIAFSVVDLRRTEAWWCDGLGFLPAGGSRLMMRGPLSAAIVDLPGAAMTCWCLVGRNDWCQLELFQYERPMARLMPADRQPNDIGYSRMGVWVADFDLALARLAKLGTQPLTAPLGAAGARRVCVRNPDGVYVELLEQDPLPEENRRGRQDCPVAIRYVSMTTPDLAASSTFVGSGLGVPEHDLQLHDDAHEALWGLADAGAKRRVFGGPTLLLEIVEYGRDPGRGREAGYRINDQGILNICFGDPRNRHGVNAMHLRALAAGAKANCRPIHMPLAGCVYVNDPLGFSYEFMWARPGRGHRDFGFLPLPRERRPLADNQACAASIEIAAVPERVFAQLSDHPTLGRWAGLGQCRLVKPGAGEVNGYGAERVLDSPFGAIHEQITEFSPNRGYRYRVLQGSPVYCHQGEVRLTPCRGGTRVDWQIRFRSRIPGLGVLLRYLLEHKLNAALAGLRRQLTT